MEEARELSRQLIDRYFRTVSYPYTRHHIDSYDQFLQQDLISIIRSQNPILILKDLINEEPPIYKYRVEIFVGGEDGSAIEIGTPTISLQNTDEVRILYPNEARLRNVTYASIVYADILVKISYTDTVTRTVIDLSPDKDTFKKFQLFTIPIMLHSRYCILHNKPKEFLREVGECPYDNGSYFIVGGAEKVLITRQEQAFNTLYITPQNDPKVAIYASIECLSAVTRQVKRISFIMMRRVEKEKFTSHAIIEVSLPFVRKAIPLFVLFRALGFQSDEEILKMIFPDFDSSEAKLLLPKLHPSIIDGFPFLNTYTAIQYIKTLTKGFGIEHVLDIIKNQLFIHMPNDPSSQGLFLGDCVRKILRVSEGYDEKTDRDDTRNQRCLTSGFLVQELFNNSYKLWVKAFVLTIGKEYNNNRAVLYKDENFKNIFLAGNGSKIFMAGLLTDMIMKGFKGKWGTGLGEEKSGVLQALSRLSYTDFMSHCRRVILDFDTNMKLTGPRKLHTSQYGYFCTSETPTGASIGIAKNLSIMTAISTSSQTDRFFEWLRTTGRVYPPEDVTVEQRIRYVPVYINGGIFGYTAKPDLLTLVLKMLKRSGCLPYSVSITFSIRDRKVYIYMDAGRPLRPLIWLYSSKNALNGSQRMPIEKIRGMKTWRELVMGNYEMRQEAGLESTDFIDPLHNKSANSNDKLNDYVKELAPYTGAIEYIDPYEQNEAFIANHPVYVTVETTHIEVHPSTIMSMMTSLIPFAPHNQSPRNQLSCSQSKQGLSIYATNWKNRFDNTAHVLCYGEMPLTRTIYNNYLGEGKMAYGMNCILAIACWSGYNQEDGIVMNYDAVQRGMFRSMAYRSYQGLEEDDAKAKVKVRFGNPAHIGNWKALKPGMDYSKLDPSGIIEEGKYVDENTIIMGAYMTNESGSISDVSIAPQVWTRGRVEKVAIMVNNLGLRLVKIRVVQDRIPELGDKFCLTDDHDVLTENGWKSIKDVTVEDKVAQRTNNTLEFVHPLNTYQFDHTGPMYLVKTKMGTQYVTGDHRMVISNSHGMIHLMKASLLYEHQTEQYFLRDEYENDVLIDSIEYTHNNMVGDKVYCLSVPNEIFLIRRNGEKHAFWTGNSNRHGQKGTIGALLRAHDMPRTESGIVPDMIMNPHAIPSRMTIAQNLEQLLGKTAALSGGIGDGTSFMNDGSPQEAIGEILEEMGFEKYGNEVMYNGATGEQIPTAIFIGPVYGMRLKHMVEDKWQARGQGRREMRTHQPTGGRGAQGGLKIGEMDRDAIIAHGGMSFVKESFMERSDGAKIPLCVACGMIPIFNPRLNLAICSMCDGPVKYTGNTVANLEILPPLGRPKSRIVQVEIPYSTKLLTHEQESYLNMAMRFMTTSGFQRLTPFEFSGTSSKVVENLPQINLPPIVAPAYVEDMPVVSLTVKQLRSIGAQVNDLSKEEQAKLDAIQEERLLDENGEEIIQLDQGQGQDQMESQQFSQMGQGFQQMQPQMQLRNQIIIPQTGGMMAPDFGMPVGSKGMSPMGGMMAPDFGMPVGSYAASPHQDGVVEGGTIPGMGPMIAVRTDKAAFEEDGLMADGLMGGRPIRRNMYRGGMNMGPMGPMVQQYTPASGGYLSAMGGNGQPSAMQPITITKLE
uniref:DNA-directed RNA polymerase n=1 Tax=viral metagenome TaxID=1070528 RepID=A0A6C0BI39_9ZZZZ